MLIAALMFSILMVYALWEREDTRRQEQLKRERLFYWYYIFPMEVRFRKMVAELGDKLIEAMRQTGIAAREAGETLAAFIRTARLGEDDD